MGEKDFSDRTLVGDDSLSFVSRDVFRAVRSGIADPIARAETWLAKEGVAASELKKTHTDALALIASAVEEAVNAPWPAPADPMSGRPSWRMFTASGGTTSRPSR